MKPETGSQKPPAAPLPIEEVQGRAWVTRSGIKVDRMASAWLIRRFIDPKARFKFVPAKGYAPAPHELRFDMLDAEFTHEGELCTFDVLIQRFVLRDPALRHLAEIVHDIDLKDAKFGREEAAGVGLLVTGIAAAHPEDEDRLARGTTIFASARPLLAKEWRRTGSNGRRSGVVSSRSFRERTAQDAPRNGARMAPFVAPRSSPEIPRE